MTSQSETTATKIQRKRWLLWGWACIVASPVRGGVNLTIRNANFEIGRRFGGKVYWFRTANQANRVIQKLVGDKKAIGAVVKVTGTIDQADALIRWAAWHVTAVIIPEAEIAAEHHDIHRIIKRYFENLRRRRGLDQLNKEYAEGCERGSMPPYRAWMWSRLAERVTAGWA